MSQSACGLSMGVGRAGSSAASPQRRHLTFKPCRHLLGCHNLGSRLKQLNRQAIGALAYLRDGAAGVPVAPLPQERSAEADRNRQWREVGVGAQILRDLGVTSIRHLTSSVHDYKGLSGFGIEIVSNEQLE